jgi:DNA-binding HxlR family transcriptional regulator
MKPMPRTYDDPCGLARALNLIGERWALLIVRELLLGPKRFTDLRRGLPGASQSVLTQRLGELERAGVLRRRPPMPPAGVAYELTDRGHELEPALLALSAWGSRSPMTSAEDLSVDALALALRTTFDPVLGGDLRIRCEVRLDGDRLGVVVADGRLSVTRGSLDAPDDVLETTAAEFRKMIFGNARSEGSDPLSRLLRSFPRPIPA